MITPGTGFDVLPLPQDICPAADLVRIKYYRNLVCHSDDGKMTDTNFDEAWLDITEVNILEGIDCLL